MRKELLADFGKYVSLNVLSMLALSVYILADTYFVANGLGAAGLASLNLAISVYSFIYGIALMLGIGGATRYSIERSRTGSETEGNRTFTAVVRLGLAVGFIYVLIGVFWAEPLAMLLGGNEDTLAMTTVYLRTVLCFAPAFILSSILTAFIRNDGSPRTAMAGMVVSSLSNIVLDYIFIFPLQMGMFGAAFATGLASVIGLAVMSPYFIIGKNKFRLQRLSTPLRLYGHICALGVSSMVTELASGIVLIVFNLRLVQLGGNITVAAYGVVANLSLITVAVFTGIGQGVQPLVSSNYGAGRNDNVNRLLKYSVVLSSAVAAAVIAVIMIFGTPIADMFNGDSNPLFTAIAAKGLRIYFIGFLFAGLNVFLSIYFSAVEQPRLGFAISILRGFALIIPLALLLSEIWGVTGIWLTFPVTEALVFALMLPKLKGLQKSESPMRGLPRRAES